MFGASLLPARSLAVSSMHWALLGNEDNILVVSICGFERMT